MTDRLVLKWSACALGVALSLPLFTPNCQAAEKVKARPQAPAERDVAQRVQPMGRDRIAFGAAAMIGDQHERQVGPRLLAGDPRRQRPQVGIADRILGQQDESGVVVDMRGVDLRDLAPRRQTVRSGSRHSSRCPL